MESVSLYTEARNEYLKQLSTWIVPPLVEFFRKEYNTIAEKDPRKAMGAFQTFCSEVPRWNQDVIDTNTGIILDTCRCDYVEELMTAVFIAHTKMLTAIRVSTKHKKLQITLPKLDHFLHRVFIECARAFWKAPFLFASELSPIEKQKNILQAEAMCTESLSGAVRSLLPVKNILRDYLEEEESDDKPSAEEKTSKEDVEEDDTLAAELAEPAVSAPAVSVPAVAAPVVSAPAVAAPAVSAPAVSAPAVSVPAVSVPAVAASAVSAPAVSVPAVAAPAVAAAVVVPEPVAVVPDPVAVAVAALKPEPALKAEPEPALKAEPEEPAVVIEKLATPPSQPLVPTDSPHAVAAPAVQNSVTIEKSEANPPHLTIETEPSVHFTPYDTVFHDTKDSEILYAPKVSVEDLPPSTWGLEDEVPKLKIAGASTSLSGIDIEELEPHDIDAPLNATADFEELK